jgi:ABC-type branched-subunit amino acid transport system substrate-binding protein
VSDNVSTEEREAMLSPLESYILTKNSQTKTYKKPPSNVRMEGWFAAAHVELSLSQWVLTGSEETWRGQLEEHYLKEPVFALIGGIVKGDWRPIHDFSEANHIPSLFPITDFPVVSETDWYTLYLSKGFYQEGEGAARYLNSIAEALEGIAIIEVVRDSPEGRALSRGFQETWLETGHQPAVSVTLKKGETLSAKLLEQVLTEKKHYVLVLWDGPEALPALEAIAASASKPERILISSGYLGKSILTLNEGLRDITFITYPLGLSQEKFGYTFNIPLMKKKVSEDADEILKKTYSLLNMLTQALIEMRGNYYRDNFLDVIGMMKNQSDPLYERLSFGPGQRYASKGCYIVQLGKGSKPELIKRSDWVIY